MLDIKLDDIWKRYYIEYKRRASFKQAFSYFIRSKSKKNEFWAIKNIFLEARKGETIAIIGRNGSGKTTLLKVLCGVTQANRGHMRVNGRVAGLLELGTGFQGDLTGRENIHLNGLILGLSKNQIRKSIGSIIDFADIGEFIDAPVRTYSAGMYLRLGFAIAVHLDPDILLLDEVLAVGDSVFQEKCLNKIKEFKNEGRTTLFVSHDFNIVEELCERIILMDKGSIVCDGGIEVIHKYLSLIGKKEIKWPTGEIKITNVYFKNDRGECVNMFQAGEGMRIVIEYFAPKKIINPVFGIGIYRGNSYLLGPNTRDDNYFIEYVEGKGAVEFRMKSLPLASSEYEVSACVHNIEETRQYDSRHKLFKFRVLPLQDEKKTKYGFIGIEGQWELSPKL